MDITLNITLNSPWYELMKDGKKIYEGRRATEKIKNMKVGDILKVEHHVDKTLPSFYIEIIDKLYFKTFEEALNELNIHEVLPIPDINVAQGVEIYKKYVSLETQLKDGVVMLKVKNKVSI